MEKLKSSTKSCFIDAGGHVTDADDIFAKLLNRNTGVEYFIQPLCLKWQQFFEIVWLPLRLCTEKLKFFHTFMGTVLKTRDSIIL